MWSRLRRSGSNRICTEPWPQRAVASTLPRALSSPRDRGHSVELRQPQRTLRSGDGARLPHHPRSYVRVQSVETLRRTVVGHIYTSWVERWTARLTSMWSIVRKGRYSQKKRQQGHTRMTKKGLHDIYDRGAKITRDPVNTGESVVFWGRMGVWPERVGLDGGERGIRTLDRAFDPITV
jgi:hypothetical protein